MFIPPNQPSYLSPLAYAEIKIYKFVAFVSNISWLTMFIFHRIQPDFVELSLQEKYMFINENSRADLIISLCYIKIFNIMWLL